MGASSQAAGWPKTTTYGRDPSGPAGPDPPEAHTRHFESVSVRCLRHHKELRAKLYGIPLEFQRQAADEFP